MKKLDDKEREARLEKLMEMKKEINSNLPEKMEKVTVMAEDKEALQKGLEKAEEIVEQMPEDMADMDMDESADDEMVEEESMSEEEIKMKIEELQRMLEAKQ